MGKDVLCSGQGGGSCRAGVQPQRRQPRQHLGLQKMLVLPQYRLPQPGQQPFFRPLLYQKARRAFHQCQRYRHNLAGLRLCLLGQLGGGARRPGAADFRQRALSAQGCAVGHADQRTQLHQRLIVVPGLFRRLMLHDPGGKGLFYRRFCNHTRVIIQTGKHPQHIAVHGGHGKSEADGRDGSGGVLPDAGQSKQGGVVGGQLPADYAALLALPGIGEYTAGAIASISFGLPVPAVDGNVLRVFSRLYNDPGVITEPAVKKAFTARVMEHQPPEKAGDYNQALMELGALVCVPNGAPLCGQCPLAEVCRARAAGTTAQLPQKAKPKPRKIVPVTLALVESPAGFLVQQRPEKGLLAGLWQPVLWEDEHLLQAEVLARLAALGLDTGTAAPAALPAAKHIFTHIEWLMSGVQLRVAAQSAPAGYVWASREQLRTAYALPGAFRAYKPLLL